MILGPAGAGPVVFSRDQWRQQDGIVAVVRRVTAKHHYGLGSPLKEMSAVRDRVPDTCPGMPPDFPITEAGALACPPVRQTGLPGGATTPAFVSRAASP